MAPKIKKRVGKRGVSYYTTVDLPPDPDGNRRQKFLSAKTKKEVEDRYKRLLVDIEQGTVADPKRMTLGEYLKYWLETYAQHKVTPRTYEGYAMVVDKHLIPALGSIPLARLQPEHLNNYYKQAVISGRKANKHNEGRLSPTTVNQHHRILHKALASAVKSRKLARNVANDAEPPSKEEKEMKILTPEQATTLLDNLRGTYLYLPTFLALNTGMRRGEILGLRWRDVDLANAVISVRQTLKEVKKGKPHYGPPKTEKSKRQIEVDPLVIRELKRQKKEQTKARFRNPDVWQENGLVNCLQNGEPVNPSTLSSVFHDAVKRLGLEIRFHDLRHTAASFLLKAGVSPKVVQEMFGHNNIATTLGIYSHLLPGMQKQAARKLTQTIFGNSTQKGSKKVQQTK